MYKKTITYTDYNDKERTEDFYFSLNEAELTEMQASTPGGYNNMIQKMIDSQDVNTLISVIKDLVVKSYGVKSDDGRRFIKKPELTEEFLQTPAYSKFYTSLITNEKEMSNFINNILPADLMAKVEKAKVENLTANSTPSGT